MRSGEDVRAETLRKAVHLSMVLWALLLRWLPWKGAFLLALLALAFTALVLPRLGGAALHRASDRSRGWAPGIVLYPASIAALILVFREQLAFVGAAWALLALGDGMATVVGLAAGKHPLPWNPKKSWQGLGAHVLFGFVGAWFLLDFIGGPGLPDGAITAPGLAAAALPAAALLAALATATVETLDLGVDDNVLVPAVGAAVTWLVVTFAVQWEGRDPEELARRAGVAVLLCVALAVAAMLASSLGLAGGAAAVVNGAVIAAFAGWGGFLVLLSFFVLGSAATRLGRRVKERRGIAESRGGRRGVANVVANGGMATLCALVTVPGAGVAAPGSIGALAGLALVAAMATAAFDTVSSEVGKAHGRRTFLPTTWKPVAPGTEGAVSVEGTLAGLAAAIVVGVVGGLCGLLPYGAGDVPVGALVAVACGAFVGTSFESLVGALATERGVEVDGHLLNFANTALGGLAAVFFLVV